MADNSWQDSTYGQFGRAIYSPDDKDWSFARKSGAYASFHVIGKSVYLPNNVLRKQAESRSARQEPRSHRLHQQTRTVIDECPDLQPASSLLSKFLLVSDVVQEADVRHDAAKGELIAFASIRSKITNRTVPIAALASGESGCVLRIVEVVRQRRGWNEDKTTWLNVPTLQGKDFLWTSTHGPVQQVRLAPGVNYNNTYLAVRFPRSTLIFRITYGSISSEDSCGPGICSVLLSSIGFPSTGGHPHADVVFNPWFHQQVGIVDRTGSWSVFEYESRRMNRVVRTWTSPAKEDKVIMDSNMTDGWARISWILNLTTIVVCTRDVLTLFSIANHDSVALHEVRPSALGGNCWILDFLLLPEHMDACCVLTATHLLVYRIVDKGLRNLQIEQELRVRHFMNPEDVTMRLKAFTNEDGINILLRSSVNTASPLYCLEITERSCSILGPVEMPRISTDPHFTNASVADLHLAKVGTHNMQLPAHHQVRFASATMLMSDYTVVESLLYSSSSKDYVELEPSWGSKLNNTVSRSHQQGFIVQQDADLGISSGTQSRSRGRRSRQPRRPLRPTDRPVTLTLVAEELQRPVGVSETIEDVLGLASSMLLSTDVDTIAPMRTMGDLYNSELSICDMAEGSAAFEQLIEKASGITPSLDEPDSMDRLPMVVRSVPLPAALGIEDGLERLSLESSYQHMIDQWIGVLSEHVPGRVRLAKAATVRLLSAEIALASRVIRHQPPEAESYGPPANDQQSALTWDLPLRRSQNDSPHVPLGSSNETPQLSALPTPSPTATPSITTISSHPSSFAAPELYRVSKYTSFSRPGPSVLPRPLTKVLSHWKLGADPSDYDWLSTSNRMMKWEETEADNDLTEKERAQMQKRALRHIKRQRKEAAASQAQQLASSQAPAILTASQPERASTMGSARNLVIGSSQSNGMGVAAASQVMPGRFGGKPPPRKKRKSGF